MLLAKLDTALLEIQYRDQINISNISGLTRRQVMAVLKNEPEASINALSTSLLKKWVYSPDASSLSPHRIMHVYKRLGILPSDELRHDLTLHDARRFSLVRHLKHLDVALALISRGEEFTLKFSLGKLYYFEGILTRFISRGDLLISNERILLTKQNTPEIEASFTWGAISDVELTPDGVAFAHENKRYLMTINDPLTLHQSMKNYFAKTSRWKVLNDN